MQIFTPYLYIFHRIKQLLTANYKLDLCWIHIEGDATDRMLGIWISYPVW